MGDVRDALVAEVLHGLQAEFHPGREPLRLDVLPGQRQGRGVDVQADDAGGWHRLGERAGQRGDSDADVDEDSVAGEGGGEFGYLPDQVGQGKPTGRGRFALGEQHRVVVPGPAAVAGGVFGVSGVSGG
jgi:hypothetical protein